MGKLDGKVAIVTGAGSGMGRAIAKLYAKEGASVVVADLNRQTGLETTDMIRAEGGEASFFEVDVASDSQVKELVDFTVSKYGRLDIMVNNAGIALFGRDGPVTEISEDTWNRVLDVNLKGVFHGMKYAIPKMLANSGGSIINVASIAGMVGFPGLAAYCASKGGIIQLTRASAIDFGDKNIRINAICPGVIKTAMTKDILAQQDMKQFLDENTILPRFGEPEDIAKAALYLASDDSAFMTGATLTIDGGWTSQ